ncbi:hypothetical protein L0222_05330 [bacterium]|nr:hypothetical protein [bacterium]
MGLLIYAGLVFLLSLAALKKQSRLILFLLQFQSFLFVFFFFWFTLENYQILQVQKVGYQFEKITNNFRDPARSVSIGGDQAKDDLYSADLPPAAIRITPSLSATQADVKVLADGILVLRGRLPLNAMSLKDGDKIQCGDREMTFLNKGAFQRGFSYQNQNWSWPRNEWRLQKQKEPVLSSNFSSRLYTVSEIAKSLGIACDSKGAVSMQQIRFSASRSPVHINSVMLFGAGKNLSVNGVALPDSFPFQNQDLLRLYYVRDSPDTTRLQASATFRIQNGENLELILPVPQILGIKEELLRNGSAINKPLFLSTTTLPYSVFPTAHYAKESKRFSGLFAFVQTQEHSYSNDLWDQLEQRLQHLLQITPANLEVVTDRGSFRPKYGDHFALGRSDKMIFSIHKVDFPWILLQTLLILWIAKMLFQPPFFASVENVGLQLLVVTVDFFLITRFLFSFRASNLYPFSSESLTLSLFAILLVPYLIFSATLLARKTWERRQAYNFLAYSMIVCILTGTLIGAYLWLTVAVVCIFSAIAFLRFHPRSFASRLKTQRDVLLNIPVEIYLGLFVLFAFLLQALGTGEAVHAFGVRFPLALIYHPLLILFACHYINRIHNRLSLEKNGDTLRLAFQDSLKLGLVLLCFVFISLLTSDFGFLLLYSVPLLFVLFGVAARYMREYEMSWKGAGLVMAVPLVLFLCVFVGSGLIDKIVPLSSMGNRYIQRILLTVDPSVLQDSGLLTAERQLGHQRTFVAYSHSGLFGGGYMSRPITAALSGTALNDNVPAAFLLNDFGISGFLAVCLILFLWIFLWWKSHTILSFGAFVSLTALITFVYVDLYMMLSNCGIFLFTGKNFFFWGLNSVSDIFHSTLLLFLLTALLPRSSHA